MINKVIIIGNLGGDPELRTTTTGNSVCNFRVATTERWRGHDGQMQEQTEWHRVTAWSRLAEICGQYLTKGSRVYVEGKLQTRTYEQDGVTRYFTEIVAREMKMLGGGRQEYAGNGPDAPQNRNLGGNASNDTRGTQTSNSGPYRTPQQQSFVPPQDYRQNHQPPGYDEDVPF